MGKRNIPESLGLLSQIQKQIGTPKQIKTIVGRKKENNKDQSQWNTSYRENQWNQIWFFEEICKINKLLAGLSVKTKREELNYKHYDCEKQYHLRFYGYYRDNMEISSTTSCQYIQQLGWIG